MTSNASNKGEKKPKSQSSKRAKRFRRISAKRIFLTYPQIDDMPRSHALAELKKVIPYIGYVICKERHANGGFHFHILFVTPKKFSIRHRSTFDIPYKGRIYSGQYKAVRNLHRSKYV